MANPNVEYLGVMAWAAQFQWIQDRTPPGDKIEITCSANKVRVGDEAHFKIDVLEKDFDRHNLKAEVVGPSGPVPFDLDLSSVGGRGRFHAHEYGMHEVVVTNEGEPVRGAPHYLRSMPKSKKDYDGM